MPGSRRTFSYSLKAEKPEEVDRVYKKAKQVLGWACDGDARIECHGVSGESLGVVTMNVTVVGRDQWATRQIVQDVLNKILWGLGHPKDVQLQLQSERKEPHTHRGYAHGRTKRYRDPKPWTPSSRAADTSDSSQP